MLPTHPWHQLTLGPLGSLVGQGGPEVPGLQQFRRLQWYQVGLALIHREILRRAAHPKRKEKDWLRLTTEQHAGLQQTCSLLTTYVHPHRPSTPPPSPHTPFCPGCPGGPSDPCPIGPDSPSSPF